VETQKEVLERSFEVFGEASSQYWELSTAKLTRRILLPSAISGNSFEAFPATDYFDEITGIFGHSQDTIPFTDRVLRSTD
jgi:hypothetical protein